MQEISLVGAQITSPASYAIQISLGLKVYIEDISNGYLTVEHPLL